MPDTFPETDYAPDDPIAVAGVELLGRTGAAGFVLRYAEDEDNPKDPQYPPAWVAMVHYELAGDRSYWEAMAAMSPTRAVLRLCEQMIDGGRCTHCQRPTRLDPESLERPMDNLACWYQYDPELKTFRRGCEGST